MSYAENSNMPKEKGYWWVSVGGNPCEPAIVIYGTKKVYTFGCPDALEAEGGHVELVQEMTGIPDTPKEAARKQAAWERQRERDRKAGTLPWTAGSIGQIINKLIALAKANNCEARTMCNGLELVAFPDSTLRELNYLYELKIFYRRESATLLEERTR